VAVRFINYAVFVLNRFEMLTVANSITPTNTLQSRLLRAALSLTIYPQVLEWLIPTHLHNVQ